MSQPKKQLIINAFAMQAPGHLNPGLFRYPKDQGRSYHDIQHWIALARKLEAAKFHAIFFADVLGGYDVYRGPANLAPTIPAAAQFPIHDPLYSIAALAAATESIGFAPRPRRLEHRHLVPRLGRAQLRPRHPGRARRALPHRRRVPARHVQAVGGLVAR
ncbi:hypothetical protein VTN02DRAFT_1254 [Thermoascus thermophilus]